MFVRCRSPYLLVHLFVYYVSGKNNHVLSALLSTLGSPLGSVKALEQLADDYAQTGFLLASTSSKVP